MNSYLLARYPSSEIFKIAGRTLIDDFAAKKAFFENRNNVYFNRDVNSEFIGKKAKARILKQSQENKTYHFNIPKN